MDTTTNGLVNQPQTEVGESSEESEVVSRAEFNELKGRVDILFNNQQYGQKEVA